MHWEYAKEVCLFTCFHRKCGSSIHGDLTLSCEEGSAQMGCSQFCRGVLLDYKMDTHPLFFHEACGLPLGGD